MEYSQEVGIRLSVKILSKYQTSGHLVVVVSKTRPFPAAGHAYTAVSRKVVLQKCKSVSDNPERYYG